MIRSKQPEADLKRGYGKLLRLCMLGSAVVNIGILVLDPGFSPQAMERPYEAPPIVLEDIPETRQERRPPPPPRPVVPIATDNPDLSDDITIETTDLDLDLDDLAPPPPLEEEFFEEVEVEEEEEVVEIWRVEKQPIPTKEVSPPYPPVAQKASIEGKVFVLVLVNKDGKVEQVGKITGPEVFHEAVRKAAEQWEFTPAIQNDKPVKVWVSLPFNFTLK
jgi:protein TonB